MIHNKPLNASRVHRSIEHVWRFKQRVGPTCRGQADLINRSLSRVRDVMTERAGVVLPLSRSNATRRDATRRNAIRGVVVCQLPNISYRMLYRDLRYSKNRLINGHRLTIDNAIVVHRVHANAWKDARL